MRVLVADSVRMFQQLISSLFEVQRDARSQDIWTTLESQGHWEGEFTLRGAAGQTTTCVLILDRIESGSNVMNQYMGIWREKR